MSATTVIGAAPPRARVRQARRRRPPTVALVLAGYAAVHVLLAALAPVGAGDAPPNSQALVLSVGDLSTFAYWALLAAAFGYVLTLARSSRRVGPKTIAVLGVLAYFAISGLTAASRGLPAGAPGRTLLAHWPAPITSVWGAFGVPTRFGGPPAHTTLVTVLVVVGSALDYSVLWYVAWQSARAADQRWEPPPATRWARPDAAAGGIATLYILWLAAELSTAITLHWATAQLD